MRVAVTGAGGRLGGALVDQLSRAPFVSRILAWDLPEHDLDDPTSAARLVSTYRPDAVIHAAAWTDVDGCARDPELALRRNGTAVGEMAEACAGSGSALVTVSTNEVFDGLRTDGLPYRTTDQPLPINPYGRAKLAGELAARAAFGAIGDEFAAGALDPAAGRRDLPALAVVRTAWLFGLPGSDFPQKILAAAARARGDGTALKLVSDEVGCPTYAVDLAAAIVALVRESGRAGGRGPGDIHTGSFHGDLAAPLHAAGLGSPRADAAPRRAASGLASRACGLPHRAPKSRIGGRARAPVGPPDWAANHSPAGLRTVRVPACAPFACRPAARDPPDHYRCRARSL